MYIMECYVYCYSLVSSTAVVKRVMKEHSSTAAVEKILVYQSLTSLSI